MISRKEIRNCACGKDHVCPIDYVMIEKDALRKLPEILDGYQKVLLVADHNTWTACGRYAFGVIPCEKDALILADNGKVVIPNEEKIEEITQKVTDSTDLIIGVGSGVINDLCKIVSFRKNLPYYIVATAPSMDGYASNGSALILGGMKVTLNARPPKGILADTSVLKDAPMDMIQSGYGDIMGKYSCLNDWKLSALINHEYFCQDIWDTTKAAADELRPLAAALRNRDEEAVGKLMEALVTVGIMMSFVGNSHPASGSEHHLSHFFEVTGILNNEPYFSHGTDVLYSSVLTAEIREKLAKLKPVKKSISRAFWISEMKRIYQATADGMIELQDKMGRYVTDDSEIVFEKWDEIAALLREAPTKEEMLKMVTDIGLSYEDFLTAYGPAKIRDAVNFAKDIKDRYTVLWLYFKYGRHIVSGHRGNVDDSGLMHENTISAIRRAIQKGAGMIETDARLTKDGVPVANHDPVAVGWDPDGNPLSLTVADVTYEELSKLRLTCGTATPDTHESTEGDFVCEGESVPLLSDILRICQKAGIMVNIDLKNGIENAVQVAELVEKEGLSGRVVYGTNASGPECIHRILQMDPEAMFIDRPVNFTREKLQGVKDYEKHCFAYTSDFSDENILAIRESGCMLAAISLRPETVEKGLSLNPEMAEYCHDSDFEKLERI